MKQSIPSYAKALFNDDMDKLEEVFEKHYDEFIDSYWLIREYSDDIDTVSYSLSKTNGLNIEILFADNAAKIVKKIRESVKDSNKVSVIRNKDTVKISIK